MDYEDTNVGFSFELPDQWRKMEHVLPLTFASNRGHIQIQIGLPLSKFIDPANREEFLMDPGCITIQGRTLGGETNTVIIENKERNEGIISAVRDNVKYDITYDNANHPAVQEAIGQLLSSFRFPSADMAAKVIQKTREAGPGAQALAKVMQTGSLQHVDAARPLRQLEIEQCETCSQRMQVLGFMGSGRVTLSRDELTSGAGAAEQCWECGRVYCDKCYPSRPPNTCVCGRGRDAVRHIDGVICRGSLRLVKVRYLVGNNAGARGQEERRSLGRGGEDQLAALGVEEVSLGVEPVGIFGESLTVSPNSSRVAYVGKGGLLTTKQFVVVDGIKGKAYKGIGQGTPIFSPDSKRVAYWAESGWTGGRWCVVVDGVEGKEYNERRGTLVFSPDSKRVGYIAGRNEKRLVVVDEQELKPYDDILGGTPIFSPDSKRVAYAAKRGSKWLVVVDEKEEGEYDMIYASSLTFSPNSKRVAYAVEHKVLKAFVVVDGVEGKEYDGFVRGSLVFSPDSKRMAYWALRKGKWLAVVDEVEGKEYDFQRPSTSSMIQPLFGVPQAQELFPDFVSKGPLIFSPDSKRIAYTAVHGGNGFAVVDGEEGRPYDDIGQYAVFSPDSKQVAYAAGRGGAVYGIPKEVFVVVDGEEGRPYDDYIGANTPVFSPDSNRMAFKAGRGGRRLVIVDGEEGKTYDTITGSTPVFSPDSRHIAYGAKRGSKWLIVIDRTEGSEHDGFLRGSKFVFDSPTSFHTLVLRDREFLRLEVEIVEKR